MHLHILGICGTFMGGIAAIAREAGHRVTGCDANVYPPMSTHAAGAGDSLIEGYGADQLALGADVYVIGNVVTRGNALMEEILDRGLPYISGPQWLAENILQHASRRWRSPARTARRRPPPCWRGSSKAPAEAGLPDRRRAAQLRRSARLGMRPPLFVIEADEYDTAFFDKRSKFVHYRPRTLIINNMEHDHADIFPDLASIQRQFHHLVRTVPASGLIIANGDQASVADTLAQGCWTPVTRLGMDQGNDWRVRPDEPGFVIDGPDFQAARLDWDMSGAHNAHNALAALLAARHVGVPMKRGLAALAAFRGMRRRQELRGEVNGVRVYDDFAHHPTAIQATIEGFRPLVGDGRLIAILEPRSNTMRLGTHRQRLPDALRGADRVWLYQSPGVDWPVAEVSQALAEQADWQDDLDQLVEAVVAEARPGDCLVVMSNGGFGGIHGKLLDALTTRNDPA
jgi:UDP-N-acetylmuramate: L-alanyl-gamma-D-glutamyl-meso-diaminopimelate ligase